MAYSKKKKGSEDNDLHLAYIVRDVIELLRNEKAKEPAFLQAETERVERV